MGLIDHLHLLLGIAVLGEVINMRNDVLVDRIRELGCILTPLGSAALGFHLGHGPVAGSGHALVCGNHDSLDAISLVERCERKKHLDGGAVRIGNDVVVSGQNVRIDLRDNEFLGRIHSPAGGIVHHAAADGSKFRGEFL